MTLRSQEIKEILSILEESGWEEADVSIDDTRIVLAKGGRGPIAAAAPAPAAIEAPSAPVPTPTPSTPTPSTPTPTAAPEGHLVGAPSVGVFWRSPEPGAPPFVEVGDTVSVGQTLCIVEVMKLMQHVAADLDGEIVAIHAENSEHVEFDTPLFTIAAG